MCEDSFKPNILKATFGSSHYSVHWAVVDVYTFSRMRMTTHLSSASHPTSSKSQRTSLLVSHFTHLLHKLLWYIFWSAYHIINSPSWVALLLACSPNSFVFLGGGVFLCFILFSSSGFLLSFLFRLCIMFLNAPSECRILTIQGRITGCYIHSHACIQKTLLSQTID